MKRLKWYLPELIVLVLLLVFFGANRCQVYFYDASTGERTKVASYWFKQNEIEIKDKWFDDYDIGDIVSGLIIIEDKNEYAVIPYSITKLHKNDEFYPLYHETHYNVKGVTWIEKSSEGIVPITSESKDIWVSLGNYPLETSFGNTLYGIPLISDNYVYKSNFLYPLEGSFWVGEGYNEDVPCYVTTMFRYSEIKINDNESYLIPYTLRGGNKAFDINDTEHFYYQYDDRDIIMEAVVIE